MVSRVRPALKSNPELRGMDVLEELDTFLEQVEEEEEGEDQREGSGSSSKNSVLVQQLSLDTGQSCAECRAASNPAMAATSAGHTVCLQEILAAQPELDLQTVVAESGSTLAHLAARKGDVDTLRVVLEADRLLGEIGDSKGATPLHVSAYHGHVECLRCLLGEGGSRVLRDKDGATAVHFAAASGHTECLRVLVEEGGGDPNEQTDSGETPVYFAAQDGHLDSVHYLVEGAQADPTLSSRDGMTPLHAAAQTGRYHITHWLVRSAKCPVMCRTCDGATPVHFAAAKGHVSILEWMLHHSLATGLERDDFGATPIHDAADNNQLECLHAFYKHDMNLEPKDNEGLTPFDLAQEKQHIRCIQFLLCPQQSFEEARRKSRDIKNAELRLLITNEDKKSATSKRKRIGSFLSRKKQKTTASTLGRKK